MKETPTSAVNRDDDSLGSPAIKLFKPVTPPRKLGMKCPPSLRNRVQSTCLDDAAHLKTYMRLWVLVEVLLLFHDQFLIPRGGFATFVYPQLVAFALAFLVPNGWTFAAAFLARSAMYFAQMPAIWESNYWATLADLAFVVNSIAAPDRHAIRQSAAPVRTIVGLFYFGSGFWKMNTAFLSPKVSCACIYMASLFGMAPVVPTQLAQWAIRGRVGDVRRQHTAWCNRLRAARGDGVVSVGRPGRDARPSTGRAFPQKYGTPSKNRQCRTTYGSPILRLRRVTTWVNGHQRNIAVLANKSSRRQQPSVHADVDAEHRPRDTKHQFLHQQAIPR